MVVETQAANVMGGKTVRACDACMRRRARWYCAADDAFLCQSCDSSIHSANQLARRHERVRLRTCSMPSSLSLSSSSSSELMKTDKKTGEVTGTPVWYEGFKRRARTPRSLPGKSLQSKKVFNVVKDNLDLNSNSNDPLVPELGSEDGSFSFSSVDENEENLNCRVPVLHFPDMVIDFKDNNIDENSFGFVPDSNKIDDEEQMDDGLNGFLPLDMDLAEFAMDMESLLGEESSVGVKELGVLEFKEESDNIEVNIDNALKSIKDEEDEDELGEGFRWNLDYECSVLGGKREEEEEEEKGKNGGTRSDGNKGEEECVDEKVVKKKKKKSAFLRLDHEAVINAWDSQDSPWTTGRLPEFSPGDCWPDCLSPGFMCPIHVLNGSEETTAVGSMPRQQGRGGGSDGEREARVLRYREKRRRRLFDKKIRYEVRKLNAEKRPRIKGRFVKRTSLFAPVS